MGIQMIYLFTALYCEADLFIKNYHLEKNLANIRFQEFYQEKSSIRLTITGVGEIAAAAAVSSICTTYQPKEEDFLLNIGICTRQTGKDGIFVCNKIIEQASNKTFYPDLLYCHGLPEETIVTRMQPYSLSYHSEEYFTPLIFPEKMNKDNEKLQTESVNDNLYDMEAAAIYQAGSYFFAPHQMMFLKLISDAETAQEVSGENVKHCMESNRDILFRIIEMISIVTQKSQKRETAFWQEETQLTRLCHDLHCSKVMEDSLRNHIHYWELAGIDYVSVIQDMYREGLLPCRDKREGKLRFEELKKRLL